MIDNIRKSLRIWANTLETNIGAQKSLENAGFILEGRSRKYDPFFRENFYVHFMFRIMKNI